MHWYNGWHIAWMWIIWLPILALVVWAIIALARSASGSSRSENSPEEILRRRYARGDIERDEYEQKLQDLSSG